MVPLPLLLFYSYANPPPRGDQTSASGPTQTKHGSRHYKGEMRVHSQAYSNALSHGRADYMLVIELQNFMGGNQIGHKVRDAPRMSPAMLKTARQFMTYSGPAESLGATSAMPTCPHPCDKPLHHLHQHRDLRGVDGGGAAGGEAAVETTVKSSGTAIGTVESMGSTGNNAVVLMISNQAHGYVILTNPLGDWGGEIDPHGADLRGNPFGGLVLMLRRVGARVLYYMKVTEKPYQADSHTTLIMVPNMATTPATPPPEAKNLAAKPPS
ncbi:hypothetical protein BDQ17DRAFT_1425037 [Cyathus striatus]|nr:hypothetical protein BDQ17DRAFT_1425037 [Cyathus striatus]